MNMSNAFMIRFPCRNISQLNSLKIQTHLLTLRLDFGHNLQMPDGQWSSYFQYKLG